VAGVPAEVVGALKSTTRLDAEAWKMDLAEPPSGREQGAKMDAVRCSHQPKDPKPLKQSKKRA
jgi:hypothetical protein